MPQQIETSMPAAMAPTLNAVSTIAVGPDRLASVGGCAAHAHGIIAGPTIA
jgi:hypothetical protein